MSAPTISLPNPVPQHLCLPADIAHRPPNAAKMILQHVAVAWENDQNRFRLGRAFVVNASVETALFDTRPPVAAGVLIAALRALHCFVRLAPRTSMNEAVGPLIVSLCTLAGHLETLDGDWTSARSGLMMMALSLTRAADASVLGSNALNNWLCAALNWLSSHLSSSTMQTAALDSDAANVAFALLERHERAARAYVTPALSEAATVLHRNCKMPLSQSKLLQRIAGEPYVAVHSPILLPPSKPPLPDTDESTTTSTGEPRADDLFPVADIVAFIEEMYQQSMSEVRDLTEARLREEALISRLRLQLEDEVHRASAPRPSSNTHHT